MSIQNESEFQGMVRIGQIVGEVLRRLTSLTRAGVTTAEIDSAAAKLLDERGVQPSPKTAYGFPGSVLISVNEEAVHGVPGQRVLREGDLVKLDVTADLDGFVADAAVTVAVGAASRKRVELRDCARRAMHKGIAAARAGRRVREIGRAVHAEVRRSGFSVIPELVGHGVGRAIHEPPNVPNYDEPRAASPLTEGLVLTVEPIICSGRGRAVLDSNGWTIRTSDGSPAAHFEHTIVITRDAAIILTA